MMQAMSGAGMEATPAGTGPSTAFRDVERRYRGTQLDNLPEGTLDFATMKEVPSSIARRFDAVAGDGRVVSAYELTDRPGVIVIPGALSEEEQWNWSVACLERFSGSRSNLHADYDLPRRGDAKLWERALTEPSTVVPLRTPGSRAPATYSDIFRRLRWTTLGYHYDWTEHVYPPGEVEPFPEDLGALCARVVHGIGHKSFVAEAAIVNFYGPKDTLMGHQDYSERDHSAPLPSFSLGLTAVFLVGGLSRDVAPSPILVRSGDCVIMSGPARLAYHGVPRIFANSCPEHILRRLSSRNESEEMVAKYMATARVNMNVRQVEIHAQDAQES